MIAGYVMSQEGKKFNRVWYQVRQDCVLYKFRAHEVGEGEEKREGEERTVVTFMTLYLVTGYQGVSCSTSARLCSYISKYIYNKEKCVNSCSLCIKYLPPPPPPPTHTPVYLSLCVFILSLSLRIKATALFNYSIRLTRKN